MRIIKYMIVVGFTAQELADRVTAKLPDGWILQGGITYIPFTDIDNRPCLVQVMVLPELRDKE